MRENEGNHWSVFGFAIHRDDFVSDVLANMVAWLLIAILASVVIALRRKG